jgi:hypothetical protein
MDFGAGLERDTAVSVDLQFFCGVRCYVALASRASYEDARNRRRDHIIPSERFGLGKSLSPDRQTLP